MFIVSMASCTMFLSLKGLFIVERRDIHNNPMIPKKIFDIAFPLF